MLSLAYLLLFFAGSVLSAPAGLSSTTFPESRKKGAISILTPAEVASFKSFTHFAASAFPPELTLPWDCGKNCEANPDFNTTAAGGDGGSIQYWYVGYSPSHESVIVGYQGTDVEKIEAIITDLLAFQTGLDLANFPGVSSAVKVHLGFHEAHKRSSGEILNAVKETIARHGAKKVITVGHSLGGALALLSGVFLPLHIPNVTFETVTYGMPRVGNPEFADYVDTHLALRHINNKRDPVPILPFADWNYRHPSGEIHIMDNNEWANCPGQENPSTSCIVGAVPNLGASHPEDHPGPYDGVTI
ncbi:hypothetical protein D9613_004387 [Agrocybe pediades]|uniref:Fungal lipase-type domain-containing protein n=1 Tax=Agrocybe pediades TaxID=84607 RepID=A0A8H4QJ92_9AGAR|nr:hypothetical protein D9613_004387 [Agrocybe pediades]